jgi:hypothetical protein
MPSTTLFRRQVVSTNILISCFFLISIVCVLSQKKSTSPIVSGSWSTELDGGWKVALSLNQGNNDQKRGSFFWLFDKQDIQWHENEEIITIQFKDAWHLYSEDSATIKFLSTPAGLKLMTEGMSDSEKKLLTGVILKPGGETPHQLANFRDNESPYSKYHERASLKLDANTVPLGLVETALKVFQSKEFEISILCRHRKIPIETLRSLMKTTSRTKSKDHRNSVKPWQGSAVVMHSIASHPNLEKKDLEVIWNLPFKYWEPTMWWKAVNHPRADPVWRAEFKQRISSKSEESMRMRSILARNKELDLEILDILIELFKTDRGYGTADLAAHPKLDAARMRKIYSANPYSTAEPLARRVDTPLDILQKIVAAKDEQAISAILELSKAPEPILKQATLKLSHSNDLNKVSVACESRHLSSNRIQELLLQREPVIRMYLARNPALPLPDLKKLTDDDYQHVASRARSNYLKRAGDEAKTYIKELRKLKELKSFMSLETEIFDVIRKDDPHSFFDLLEGLWLPLGSQLYDHRYKQWIESALKHKAHKILKQWIKESPEIKAHLLATHAVTWTPEIVSMLLDEKPTNKQLEEFVSRVIQGNRLDLLENYLERGFSINIDNQQPLVWYAIAHRNELMVRKLLKAGCDPSIPNQGVTPAMLAVQTNYTAAMGLLPLDDNQKKVLQAFKDRYPGDPDAVWLGAWTNGKSEFKTLVIQFLADGNGQLISATGMRSPIVWKTKSKNSVHIFPMHKGRVIDSQKITAQLKGDTLELALSKNRIEKMKRPDLKNK